MKKAQFAGRPVKESKRCCPNSGSNSFATFKCIIFRKVWYMVADHLLAGPFLDRWRKYPGRIGAHHVSPQWYFKAYCTFHSEQAFSTIKFQVIKHDLTMLLNIFTRWFLAIRKCMHFDKLYFWCRHFQSWLLAVWHSQSSFGLSLLM